MEFEFQESDVIFADSRGPDEVYHCEDNRGWCGSRDVLVPVYDKSPRVQISPRRNRERFSAANSSPPMVIPGIGGGLRSPERSDNAFGEEDEEGGDMVPPHVIVGRRVAGKMTSPACARNGRMLKGRYLSEVRNSILRKTGFLES